MTGQANFLQSLGWAVLNSLWQLALLWVVYQVIIGISRNTRSSFKSSLATGLLLGGFGWFVYTFFAAYTSNAGKTVISSVFVNAGPPAEVNNWLLSVLPVASVFYLVLLAFPLLHFVRNYRYVQVIRKYGLTRINVDWRVFVNKVAVQLGITKKVQIWVSEFVSSPVTIGFLKPVILVPLAAINHLTPQQLEAVLLHELSHIKRFDYLINLIINFIQTILYFNPFVKAFVKIVEKEREKSCDEMVMQFQYDSHEYASALLTLEKTHRQNKFFAIAATGKKTDLLRRVELIMGVEKKPVFSFNKLVGLVAGLFCVIALNALLLFNNQTKGNRVVSFTHMASPLNFIGDQDPVVKTSMAVAEQPSRIVNPVRRDVRSPKAPSSFASYISSVMTNPDIMNVSFGAAQAPELKKYQEKQVEQAIEASKKVMENAQWKVVEKNIADVFSQQEKEQLKVTYEKQLNKIDWKEWENNLRLAYNKVDWEKITNKLSIAVNQVRLDSMQRVYNVAIRKLDRAGRELSMNNLKGIPDTDISLKDIEQKKADVQKALNELKAVRSKKIVHL